jgi:hypothetical protein
MAARAADDRADDLMLGPAQAVVEIGRFHR